MRRSAPNQEPRAHLESLVTSGKVRVVYSICHLSEIVGSPSHYVLSEGEYLSDLSRNHCIGADGHVRREELLPKLRSLINSSTASAAVEESLLASFARPPTDLVNFLGELGMKSLYLNNIAPEKIFSCLEEIYSEKLQGLSAEQKKHLFTIQNAHWKKMKLNLQTIISSTAAQVVEGLKASHADSEALDRLVTDWMRQQLRTMPDMEVTDELRNYLQEPTEYAPETDGLDSAVAHALEAISNMPDALPANSATEIPAFTEVLEIAKSQLGEQGQPTTAFFGFLLSLLAILGYYPDHKKQKQKEKTGKEWAEIWDQNHFLSALAADCLCTGDHRLLQRARAVVHYASLDIRILESKELGDWLRTL